MVFFIPYFCTAELIFDMFIRLLNRDARRCALNLLHNSISVLGLMLLGCGQPPAFHATDITGASFGRLGTLETLSDPAGRRVASADFQGKVVVIFFGYTQCPDICPTTLLTLQTVMQQLGGDAERIAVRFVTLDPERDTAEVLAAYVPWFDARFRGLRGDLEATRRVAEDFRVFFSKVQGTSAAGYSLDHASMSYVFDPQGRIRLLIRHGETPEHIAADLRLLLAGK